MTLKYNPLLPLNLDDVGSGGGSSTFIGLTDVPASFTGASLKVARVNAGETALEFATISGGGDALKADPLSQFAATTSLQLKGVISDETGSGALVFATNPTFDGYLDVTEISAPATPGADTARIYAIDDNSNTRLQYKLPDGTTVQIARDNIHVVKNTQGSAITKGQIVYISGGVGASGTAEVKLAKADALATTPSFAIVIETSIANNGFGRVLSSGKLEDFDTTFGAEGATVFLSATVAGGTTTTEPVHPNISQRLGVIINSHVSTGTMAFVPVGRDGVQIGTNNVSFTVGTATASSGIITATGISGGAKTFTLPNASGTVALTSDITTSKIRTIGFSAIGTPTTGQQGSYVVFPVAGTITGYKIVANAGTCTIKTWKIASGTSAPTIANVISTSGVSLSSGTAIISSTTTDFTSTTVSANDIFAFDLTAVSGVTILLFELEITVT